MNGRIAGIMLWLLAMLAASAQAQTVEYLHTDALGSVVAVTDANRNVIERREYEPYGSQLTPAVTNGPGYTGHVQDAATGLVYMQQRYYDAEIGRFLSMDPVTANSGTGANFNRYWYADNNPYTFIDPTGTCTGSRIENKDGTCVSSGGNTTETYGARQGESSSTAGQVPSAVSDASERIGSALRERSQLQSWLIEEGYVDPVWDMYMTEDGHHILKDGTVYGPAIQGEPPLPGAARLGTAVRHLHHAWPKYLGGPLRQQLVSLSENTHKAFHRGLDRILPRQWSTKYYAGLAGAAHRQVLRDLAAYTRAFDAKYGTKLYDAMLRNGFPKTL